MAKWSGTIGYGIDTETAPGVHMEVITKKTSYGDVLQNTRRWSSTDKVNDDLSLSNKISIVADQFAVKNFYAMRYVVYMGCAWTISSVETLYPRLILTIGGVYSGKQA